MKKYIALFCNSLFKNQKWNNLSEFTLTNHSHSRSLGKKQVHQGECAELFSSTIYLQIQYFDILNKFSEE